MQILRFDDVVIDVDNLRVTKAGAPVELEPKSFRLLVYLAQNRDRVVKKEEIFEQIWSGAAVTDNALTRAVAQLRKALGDDARQARYIETVPTVGYRFLPAPEPAAAAAPPEPPAPAPTAPRVSWLRRLLVPLGALFAVTVGYLHRSAPEQAPLPAIRSIQITSGSGLDSHPSFSPDGSSICYASDRSGSFEIYIKLAGEQGKDVQVTNDGRQNIEPAWSPDGNFIAYHSMKERGIFLIPSFGGTPRKIADFGSQPAWAPDARRLVVRSAPTISMAPSEVPPTAPSNLWIVPLNGAAPVPLTQPNQPPGRHADPMFSPDGRRVLFATFERPQSSLWEIELETRKLARVETGLPIAYSPRFTPDGSGIFYFGVADPGGVGLYALGIDKDTRALIRKPERLFSFDLGTPRDLAIGKETRRLAYSLTTSNSNLWRAGPGAEQPLTKETTPRVTVPAYSPDGRKLAYVVRRKGAYGDIWVSDADGGNPLQITSNPQQDFLPSWTPDGRAVVYASNRSGKHALWRYSLADARESALLDLPDFKTMGKLSPNGKDVIFHRGPDDQLAVWKVDLATRHETRLSPEGVPAGYPVWSPDGSRLAVELFHGPDTYLGILPSSGGEIRKIIERPGQAWPWSWSADGKEIAISGHWDGIWNVYMIDAATGAAKPVTHNTLARVFVRYPAWPPKGNQLVFERNETSGNLFVVAPSVPGGDNMKPF